MENSVDTFQSLGPLARPELVNKIWKTLKYSSVMLVGPPGIGKTFILQYLHNNCIETYKSNYFSSINSSHDLLMEEMIQGISANFKKSSAFTSLRINSKSLNFGRSLTLTDVVNRALERLEDGVSLLLLLDDFTELLTLYNEIEGRKLMDELRHIRMQHDRVRMVLSGRNIEELGHSYGDIGFLNDLTVLSVIPLNQESIKTLINSFVSELKPDANMNFSDSFSNYITNISAGSPILLKVISKALISLLSSFGNEYSEEKLKLYFESNKTKTLNNIINKTWSKAISRMSVSEKREIVNLLDDIALSENKSIRSKNRNYRVVRVLEQEGFLVRDGQQISFAHKLFEEWWNSNRRRSNEYESPSLNM